MTKKLFIAAFVVDEETFYGRSGNDPIEPGDVVNYLSSATLDEGVSGFMVWTSAEDLAVDHREHGPITVAHLVSDDTEPADDSAMNEDECRDALTEAGWEHQAGPIWRFIHQSDGRISYAKTWAALSAELLAEV